MMTRVGTLRNRMLALGLAVILAACGSQQPEFPALEESPPDVIFNRAEFELQANNLDEAARYFGEVERLYPFSEFAKRALIMQAFTYHRNQKI